MLFYKSRDVSIPGVVRIPSEVYPLWPDFPFKYTMLSRKSLPTKKMCLRKFRFSPILSSTPLAIFLAVCYISSMKCAIKLTVGAPAMSSAAMAELDWAMTDLRGGRCISLEPMIKNFMQPRWPVRLSWLGLTLFCSLQEEGCHEELRPTKWPLYGVFQLTLSHHLSSSAFLSIVPFCA